MDNLKESCEELQKIKKSPVGIEPARKNGTNMALTTQLQCEIAVLALFGRSYIGALRLSTGGPKKAHLHPLRITLVYSCAQSQPAGRARGVSPQGGLGGFKSMQISG